MLFTVSSSLRFSASIFASLSWFLVVVGPAGPGIRVPLDRKAPAAAGEPEDWAVPTVFVPGGTCGFSRPLSFDRNPVPGAALGLFAVPVVAEPGVVGTLDELPAPLGSLAELFRPPALAGPEGTPLTDCEPAPAEPALGVPAALGLPAEGPLAAPPALAPLAPPPLPLLPPLPPPPP